MAKKFFYVCAGIFMLAVSFHLGATTVTAQGNAIEAANMEQSAGGQYYTFVIGRTMYAGSGYPWDVVALSTPVPGGSRIVATSGMFAGPTVMLENGDVFGWTGAWNSPGGGWELRGNVLGATVSTQRATWGSVKLGQR